MKGRTLSNQKAGVKKLAVGGMGLQKRQFGTGPGLKPMPKHIGKAITDRGKAIMAPLDAARAARNAPPTRPMSSPPPPMAAPAGRMSNMAMVKKGGMLKAKKR